MMAHVRTLAVDIGARPTGGQAAGRAAAYITGQLTALGLAVEEQVVGTLDLAEIRIGPRLVAPARHLEVFDRNLIVRVPAAPGAAGAPILVMAHYDSVATTPGAVDNAVGVAIVLELARLLVDQPPLRPVLLAFPAAEETRLAGSHRLAELLGDRVGLAISLDLVGGPGRLTLNGLSSLLGQEWLRWLAAVGRRAGVDLAAPWPHRIISRWWPQIERSDHGPFTARGVPAFHLYTRDADRLDLAYHGPRDTADHVDPAAVGDAADFVLALLRTPGPLPEKGGPPGLWLRDGVLSTWVVVAVELLLLAIAIAGLFRLWRGRAKAAPGADPTRPRPWRLGLSLVLGLYALAVGAEALVCLAGARIADHPGPWVHAPARNRELLLLLGIALGYLLGKLVTRRRPVPGRGRYLALAIVLETATGLALMAVGATEVAWLWLLSAALHGAMPWLRGANLSKLVVLAAVLPLLGPTSPGFLREGVFNGFFPAAMPLAAYLGLLVLPQALALTYYLLRFPPRPRFRIPRWAGNAVAAALAIACIVALLAPAPRCTGNAYRAQGLACER